MATLEKQIPLSIENPDIELRSKAAHDIGHSGVPEQVEVNHIPASLPEGYEYADVATIQSREVSNLFRQVDIGEDIGDDYFQERAEELQDTGEEVIDVGVRDSQDDTLVGFGSIARSGAIGRLGDFVVSPKHQSRGIGKTLITERLAIADASGIAMLKIHNMEPTNTLRSFYVQQGFVEAGDGNLVRMSDARIANPD